MPVQRSIQQLSVQTDSVQTQCITQYGCRQTEKLFSKLRKIDQKRAESIQNLKSKIAFQIARLTRFGL